MSLIPKEITEVRNKDAFTKDESPRVAAEVWVRKNPRFNTITSPRAAGEFLSKATAFCNAEPKVALDDLGRVAPWISKLASAKAAAELRGKAITFLVTSDREALEVTFLSPALVSTVLSLIPRVTVDFLNRAAVS